MCEWTRTIGTLDGRDVTVAAPHASAFLKTLRDTLESTRPLLPTPRLIDGIIATHPDLHHVYSSMVPVPVGGWSDDEFTNTLGSRYRDTLVVYAHAMRPFLERANIPSSQVTELIGGFVGDLRAENRLVSTYYVVLAERA